MSTLCRLLSLATVRGSCSLVSASSGMKWDIWELWELLGKQQAEVRAEFKDWMSRAEDCESNLLGSWEHAACCVEDVHIHTSTSHLNWDFPLSYAVLNTKKWKSPKWKSCPYRFHSGFTCCSHGSVTLTSRKLFGLKLASYITTLLTIDDGPIYLYLFLYNFAP